jgi:hypothetical protein
MMMYPTYQPADVSASGNIGLDNVGSTSNLRSHPAIARPTAEVIDLTLDSNDDESSKSVKKTLDVIDLTADDSDGEHFTPCICMETSHHLVQIPSALASAHLPVGMSLILSTTTIEL